MPASTSTVRFSQVVKKSGTPEPYTPWTDPKSDPDFRRALEEDRVMTVHQETVGTQKDYGTVGYTQDQQGTLLIFPRSLKRFAGKRVVGMKYELLKSVPAAPREKTAPAARSGSANRKTIQRKKEAKAQPARLEPTFTIFRPEADDSAANEADTGSQRRDKVGEGARGDENARRELKALRGEVRKALQSLHGGKAVAAYQRLERALGIS